MSSLLSTWNLRDAKFAEATTVVSPGPTAPKTFSPAKNRCMESITWVKPVKNTELRAEISSRTNPNPFLSHLPTLLILPRFALWDSTGLKALLNAHFATPRPYSSTANERLTSHKTLLRWIAVHPPLSSLTFRQPAFLAT